MTASPDIPPSGPAALHRLQQNFIRELLYRVDTGLGARIATRSGTGGLSAAQRLGIYRSNVRENFAVALASAFPLLEVCIGPHEFRQLAWSFQRACPSPSGNLFHIGRGLVAFLKEHVRGNADEYLIDVAVLEWMIQESLVAADHNGVLDLYSLAAVPQEQHGNIQFELHPAVRLLTSEYAIFQLWEAHQQRPPAERNQVPMSPPRDAEHLLVQRQADGIQLRRLTELDHCWLHAVARGDSLAESVACLPVAQQPALAQILTAWVQCGVVVGFSLRDPVG